VKLNIQLFLFMVLALVAAGGILLWIIRRLRREDYEAHQVNAKARPEIGFHATLKTEPTQLTP